MGGIGKVPKRIVGRRRRFPGHIVSIEKMVKEDLQPPGPDVCWSLQWEESPLDTLFLPKELISVFWHHEP